MKYDYIVVGSGSAGSIIATRLSEDPAISVLLIEAGPDFPDHETLPEEVKWNYSRSEIPIDGSDYNWQFTGKATDYGPPMTVPRGKVTGGSSAINAQIFLRGEPDDYDRWAGWGNHEWAYEKVLPFFRKLENDQDFSDDYHGNEGPILARRTPIDNWSVADHAFYAACLQYGYAEVSDHNNPDSSGVGPIPKNDLDGVRISTAMGYLSMARHRLNLTIKSDCHVRRIIFEGSRAVGVEVQSGGESFVAEAEEIILSAGPIGSPHILMLSGVGPAMHLEEFGIDVIHNLPGVGQNLRDHPALYLAWKTKPEYSPDSANRPALSCRYTADGSDLRNDMMIIMLPHATERIDRSAGRSGHPVGVGMVAHLYLAMAVGELKLQSNDYHQQPFLDYRLLDDPFDMKRVRDQIHICLKLAQHPDFQEILEKPIYPSESDLESDDALDDWMLRTVTTGHHISGTCKMGPSSDDQAVVNQFGKVHGIDGLRIADASIMPDCIRANTNVPTMMIGERIADFLMKGL